MSTSRPLWIWYPGDFEIYHHLLLNTRREERSHQWPAFWKLDDCYHNVRFRKEVRCDLPETITVYARGVGHVSVDGKKYAFGVPIELTAGTHGIGIQVARTSGLPCIYVEGAQSASDASWEADDFSCNWLPAGCNELYTSKEDDPNVFAFHYEKIGPQKVERKDGGILYDYGKETFAAVVFDKLNTVNDVHLFYGESVEEALDTAHSILIDVIPSGQETYRCPPRAFRYLFIQGAGSEEFELTAFYEYLPLTKRGAFACSDETVNHIWEVAEYTFHLNCREFFLDGIKRDRWVWSGDAYQSYWINNYLYFDPDLTKRTIIGLRGKDPIAAHINTILDYSFYWIMSVRDYYETTKDRDFIAFIYPRMKSMMDYCVSLIDEDGFIRGRNVDWVFIDWADMDKTGAVCAEQMLLAESLKATWQCGEWLGVGERSYWERYESLKVQIRTSFWNQERGCYIDSFESGNNNVTRHANIFAVLWNYANEDERNKMITNVLLNDEITQIKTPYFKFYELEAMCKIGQLEQVTERITDYWGGLLQLGATTFWEEYDPSVNDPGRLSMYGDKYGKSLCHAWGASPIYLLGRYYLGVYPTSARYESFVVEPSLGGFSWIKGTVPLPDGSVKIELSNDRIEVLTDKDGGVVRIQDQEFPLVKDIPFIFLLS